MSMSEQRESFSAALHEAARSFEPPRPDLLYDDARRRGRRIKRQRTFGAGLSVVVMLAVVGVLAATFAGSGGVTATPAATPTGPVTAQYMAAAFRSVLPSNAKLDESAAQPMIGYGYTSQGTDGGWYAGATATVLVSGKAYVFALSVMTGQMGVGDCLSPGSHLLCYSGTLHGGTFSAQTSSISSTTMYVWSPHEPPLKINQPPNQLAIVVTVRPVGKAANGSPSPFTVEQIEQLAIAKVWNEVSKDMPAVRE